MHQIPCVVALAVAFAGCTVPLPDFPIAAGVERPVTPLAEGSMAIHFVDVGQGDGIVVEFPDGVMVVDTGRNGASSDPLVALLQDRGHAVIDHLVITHPDADHSGGCDVLFETFHITNFYHPGLPKDTRTWEECEFAAEAEGAGEQTDNDLDPGDLLPFSQNASVTLLHLDGASSDHNEGSIVMHIGFGEFDAILVGDAGCDTEEAIIEHGFFLDVEVLQGGHHGSRYSTCTPWLEATTPEHVVFSVGNNNYGHPHADALGRVEAIGATIHRTDLHGTVTVTTDGETYAVTHAAGA